MHPRDLSINDFTYNLPEEQIARYPLAERDSSKLLVYRNHEIDESHYKNLDQYIPPNSLMVLNNTKVIEARLLFQKPTGAVIEIFCLEPFMHVRDISIAMANHSPVTWLCLIGGASKWKPGQILQKKIEYRGNEIIVHVRYLEKVSEAFAIEISWSPESLSFAEVLHFAGKIPLPPYLKREAEKADKERYQTLYANLKGSVAAPTAGLHFTDTIFKKLTAKNVRPEYVTLHVGAGTFKPVKSSTMETHDMHAEYIDVGFETIETISQHPGKFVTAVGTTSLRTIESLYWMGVKVMNNQKLSIKDLVVSQWEPYEKDAGEIEVSTALAALTQWMTENDLRRLLTKTQILIAPGYQMKVADALITNFHQPQSTLLLLVAAFIGEDWKKVYQYALENDFRFLSYGDGCLLFRNR